ESVERGHGASGRPEHELDGSGVGAPSGGFRHELLSPGSGQPVELGSTSFRRNAPLGEEPATLLEAVKRRIEGALMDLEHLVRGRADLARDRPAVERSTAHDREDEEVQRALLELGPGHGSYLDGRQQAYSLCCRPSRYDRGGVSASLCV